MVIVNGGNGGWMMDLSSVFGCQNQSFFYFLFTM